MAFTYVRSGADGRPDIGRWTGLVLWLLERGGEPWLWSIRPDELPELLEDTGWHELADYAGGSSRHGVEYFTVASR